MRNKTPSAKLNYIYSVSYSVLTMILPLITAPYIARVVGANGLGIYTYNYTIVSYFMTFALLGVNFYGNRSIAKVRDDIHKRNIVFSEIYTMQLLTSFLMIVFYFGYILGFVKENKEIAYIMVIYVISPAISVNWFFYGLEMFKITVTRNLIVKLATVASMFIFVHSLDDLWKYVLILALGTIFSEGYLIIILHKYIRYKYPGIKNVLQHFKPNITLCIPILAVSIYRSMDKLMLKWLVDYEQVGFFSNSEKIIDICLAFIIALGQVMLPRMTNLLAIGDNEKFLSLITKSLKFVSCMSIAMFFGLLGVANSFVPLFFGSGYEPCIVLLQLLSINLVLIGWGNVLKSVYLIPKEKDSLYIISVFVGAIVNLIINLMLIGSLKAIGATIGTICAEFVSLFIILYNIRRELPILKIVKEQIAYFFIGAIMFTLVYAIGLLDISSLIKILCQVIAGVFIYFVLSLIYWHRTKDEFKMIVINQLFKISNRIRKK